MNHGLCLIRGLVEREAGLAPLALQSRRNTRDYTRPRWIAIKLCRDFYPHITVTELGKVFARDHSTITNSLQKFYYHGLHEHDLYVRCKPKVATMLKLPLALGVVARAEPGGQVWVR